MLGNIFRLDLRFHVITIRLTNYDILMRLSGKSGVDPIMRAVVDCLVKDCKWYRIFRASTTAFMILSDIDKPPSENI